MAAASFLIGALWVLSAPQARQPQSVPFAQALGVGSGWNQIREPAAGASSFDLQIELRRARAADPLSSLEVHSPTGRPMVRDLPGGYRLRWASTRATGDLLELEGFELSLIERGEEVSLLAADLRTRRHQPFEIGLTGRSSDDEPTWLTMTWRTAAAD